MRTLLLLLALSLLPRGARAEEAKVPVSFIGTYLRHPFFVNVDGETCVTPCVLELAPGEHKVIVRGPRSYSSTIVVPERPTSVELRYFSRRAVVAGTVLTLVGLGTAAAGAGVLGVYRLRDYCALESRTTGMCLMMDREFDPTRGTVGVVTLLAGISMLAVGIPFLAKRGSDEVIIRDDSAAAPGVRLAGLQLSAGATSGMVGAAFEF